MRLVILLIVLLIACQRPERDPSSNAAVLSCLDQALDTTALGPRVLFIVDGMRAETDSALRRELATRVVVSRDIVRNVQPSHGPVLDAVVQLTTRARTSRDGAGCDGDSIPPPA